MKCVSEDDCLCVCGDIAQSIVQCVIHMLIMIRHTLLYPVFVLIVVITDNMTMSLSDEEHKL